MKKCEFCGDETSALYRVSPFGNQFVGRCLECIDTTDHTFGKALDQDLVDLVETIHRG